MKDNWIAILRDACTRIDDWIKSNPKETFAEEVERVVYDLLKRANDNVGAILCLNNNWYSETAMGLSRVTIELLVDIMMIKNDPENIKYLKESQARSTKKIFELTKDVHPQNRRPYEFALKEFKRIIPQERRDEERWKRDRWGMNLKDVMIKLDKLDKNGEHPIEHKNEEHTFEQMYNQIVTQEQVYLHGGLLPEWYSGKAQDPEVFIGINSLLLVSIIGQCKKTIHSKPLPDLDDLDKRIKARLAEEKGSQ